MCVEIQIKDGPRIESCGELWELVGRDNVVFKQAYLNSGHQAEANECLCHVDVERTAANAGYSSRNGWDEASCDFIWQRQ